ncbi:hypothetical protein KIN20_023588 [Parelaphostrongylus tenuis]|uniref:Uncharacterized protein n=1 Tax=Parelaphostrongylus tenuis TaxID=148309 RepID=A0AAD5NCA5_PARTN|nr:hypothetical protein KIN20_023588 [Parelaphostrongylus tenuis]
MIDRWIAERIKSTASKHLAYTSANKESCSLHFDLEFMKQKVSPGHYIEPAYRQMYSSASVASVLHTTTMVLFTVEQLELIRRLRSTGISPAQITEAFRQLEQMDSSLDASAQSMFLSSLINSPDDQRQPELDTCGPMLLQALQAQPPVPVTISASPSEIVGQSPERLSIQTVPPASAGAPSEPTTSQTPDSSATVSEAATVPSSTAPLPVLLRYENNIAGRPIRSLRTPMKEITTLDRPEELDEFMEQGEEACIADMKQFITQYSLRQTTVAMMTGKSILAHFMGKRK